MSRFSSWWRKLLSYLFPVNVEPDPSPDPEPDPVPAKTVNAAWFGTWFMSPTKTDEYRRTELQRMTGAGMTAVYWCLNSVNGKLLYGEHQDEVYWRYWMQQARAAGIEQVWLWFMDNRSDSINRRDDAFWNAMFEKVSRQLGDLAHGYVLGLESEEYLSEARSRKLLADIKRITGKPVGFHTSPGTRWVNYGRGVADYFFFQVTTVDSPMSEGEMGNRVRAAQTAFGGPVVAAEWCRYENCGKASNNRLGDAAIRAGAVGVGGGCTAEGLRILRERARTDIQLATSK